MHGHFRRSKNLEKLEKLQSRREFLESKKNLEIAELWTAYLLAALLAAGEAKDKGPSKSFRAEDRIFR